MILKNCRLIPALCEGFQEEFADIRIEADRIAEILPAGGNYTGEEVIDCSGKTVLPGLYNLHMHCFFKGDEFTRDRLRNEYEMTILSLRYVQELLSYGYTSLRDVGTQYNTAIKLRDSINAGELTGPNMTACGIIFTPDQIAPPLGCYSAEYGYPINDPFLVRHAVRKQLAEGADFIKILGCSAKPTRRGDAPLFYDDEMKEFVHAVEQENTYLAVHTNGAESLHAALNWAPYTIEHAHFMEQDHVDRILKDGCKSMVVPTFQITWAWGACKEHCSGIRYAYDAGLTLGWGTDATETMFLTDPAAEFIARREIAGMDPIEILKQATINSAIINKEGDERGSVKVGKKADFAIFEGNPDEDFTLFGTPAAYVLRDGIVVASHGKVNAIQKA